MHFKIVYEILDTPLELDGGYFVSEHEARRLNENQRKHFLLYFVRASTYTSQLAKLEGRISSSVVDGPYEKKPTTAPASRGPDDFTPPFVGVEIFPKVIPVEDFPDSLTPIKVWRYGMRAPQEVDSEIFRRVRYAAVQSLEYLGKSTKKNHGNQAVFSVQSLDYSLLLNCYDGDSIDKKRSLNITIMGIGTGDVQEIGQKLGLEDGLRQLLENTTTIENCFQQGWGYGDLKEVDLGRIGNHPNLIL